MQLSSQKTQNLFEDIMEPSQTMNSFYNKKSYTTQVSDSNMIRAPTGILKNGPGKESMRDSGDVKSYNFQTETSHMTKLTKTPTISQSYNSAEIDSAEKELGMLIKQTNETYNQYYSDLQHDKDIGNMRMKLKQMQENSSQDFSLFTAGKSIVLANNTPSPSPQIDLNMTTFSMLNTSYKKNEKANFEDDEESIEMGKHREVNKNNDTKAHESFVNDRRMKGKIKGKLFEEDQIELHESKITFEEVKEEPIKAKVEKKGNSKRGNKEKAEDKNNSAEHKLPADEPEFDNKKKDKNKQVTAPINEPKPEKLYIKPLGMTSPPETENKVEKTEKGRKDVKDNKKTLQTKDSINSDDRVSNSEKHDSKPTIFKYQNEINNSEGIAVKKTTENIKKKETKKDYSPPNFKYDEPSVLNYLDHPADYLDNPDHYDQEFGYTYNSDAPQEDQERSPVKKIVENPKKNKKEQKSDEKAEQKIKENKNDKKKDREERNDSEEREEKNKKDREQESDKEKEVPPVIQRSKRKSSPSVGGDSDVEPQTKKVKKNKEKLGTKKVTVELPKKKRELKDPKEKY